MIIVRGWKRRRAQQHCFHHEPKTPTSWIESALIDLGRRKMFWCTQCDRTWIV